ncbi:5-formyltetrahydrofolate cyclo-ligase [Parasulfitobacter algicola]|uniref:5-formyltetrahydrofolate cyclo-ligase n=1 Tax=Parasulfitobacter algicola TaxID=2614809 RepID=A0ABX2J0D4_9RHOB|nr:5-formyltetrahydrofolate cyclo-ligase [Sulfitobacter algicola]NSX56503.1 5-formyltetrahydrofolate cyclo-ligase [Sulfitobacter algicola]
MSVADEKSALRTQMLQRRDVAKQADAGASAGLLSEVLAGYRGVPVAGYLPINSEINPLPAMSEAVAHGRVGVPVITARDHPLQFRAWHPDGALMPGPFKVMVPVKGDWIEPELLIVPLAAFDRKGGRLGYGGGFYDRTLQNLRTKRATLAIGFAYSIQQVDQIPLEQTDQPLDMIITEKEVITVP